ncbi:hypothetical protein MES5069_230234 [Mesorhizobium escarrei]|uniref:Uncharacterized protein n=1 Tax=Mesorhizobium escarrei TaxID=666018 RepID=A0ABN8JQE8_9HYPH|nr:hypothetical protein MES5069_230234 [Mesorhizobium escarrei]
MLKLQCTRESRASAPGFFMKKPRNSGVFSTLLTLFDLVAEALLSKVRFLPDESYVPVSHGREFL